MAFFQSVQAANRLPIPSANTATDLVPIVATFVIPAGLANGDIIEMGPLQAGYVPVDFIAAFPDADTGTGITFDAGMLSGNWLDAAGARTIGSEFVAGDTTAQASGISRMNKAAGAQIAPTTNDRSWGLKMSHAVGTALTAGGTITATLLVRPKIEGV